MAAESYSGSPSTQNPSRRSLLLRLCDRFGMERKKTGAERSEELCYRAERLAEMQAELPRLVAGEIGFEETIRRIHGILNRGKKLSNFHRFMRLLHPEGYKEGNYRETHQRGADYLAPPAADVPALMRNFGERLDDLVSEPLDDAQTRLVCGWALAMMIRIHPFTDGNGRTTRTLMNLLLSRAGHAAIDFPSDSEIYKRSPVWSGLKGHMRLVREEQGWSLRNGSVPPAGYHDRLRDMLERELATVSVSALMRRPDIVTIGKALETVRRDGFNAYRHD